MRNDILLLKSFLKIYIKKNGKEEKGFQKHLVYGCLESGKYISSGAINCVECAGAQFCLSLREWKPEIMFNVFSLNFELNIIAIKK